MSSQLVISPRSTRQPDISMSADAVFSQHRRQHSSLGVQGQDNSQNENAVDQLCWGKRFLDLLRKQNQLYTSQSRCL